MNKNYTIMELIIEAKNKGIKELNLSNVIVNTSTLEVVEKESIYNLFSLEENEKAKKTILTYLNNFQEYLREQQKIFNELKVNDISTRKIDFGFTKTTYDSDGDAHKYLLSWNPLSNNITETYYRNGNPWGYNRTSNYLLEKITLDTIDSQREYILVLLGNLDEFKSRVETEKKRYIEEINWAKELTKKAFV